MLHNTNTNSSPEGKTAVRENNTSYTSLNFNDIGTRVSRGIISTTKPAGSRKVNSTGDLDVVDGITFHGISRPDGTRMEDEESPVKGQQTFLRGGRKRGRLRHESTDTEGSETSSTLERAPPDGGYG